MESYTSAVGDFRRARNRAALQEILERLTGKSTELLSYEDVRQKLRATGVVSHSLREIPLDAIVGSVGRYNDFTRNFLPKLDSDQDRWARVKVAASDMGGLPPVEVYQIGEAYFVHDGHHRISIARQIGADTVQAYVTEIRSRVPLAPDSQPDDLIIMAEYVEFLNQTKLDAMYPETDLSVTRAGQYQKLLDHIEVHRHYMGLEQMREIPYEEAVSHWYETVYLPVVEIIRELGIMQNFPLRTETDLYLWIGKHRSDIEKWLGWEIPTSAAAVDLVDRESAGWTRSAAQIGRRVLNIVVPDELDQPAVQTKQTIDVAEESVFASILVGISGDEMGWLALEQAIEVARREGGRLRGLYVIPEEEIAESNEALAIRDRFYWRCGEVGIEGKFVVDVEPGPIANALTERAPWSDLVVVSLAHPPDDSALSRWGSGFRSLIRRSSRPVLAVPGQVTPMARHLLAYDGSPKAMAALYVATYLTGSWKLPLVVVTVAGDGIDEETLEEARIYLERHQIEADYLFTDGPAAEILMAVAQDQVIDLLILGGYGGIPVVEVVLGNVLDTLLGSSEIPMLICR